MVTCSVGGEEHNGSHGTHVYGRLKDSESELMKTFSASVHLHDSDCKDDEGTYYLLHLLEEYYKKDISFGFCDTKFDIWDCQKKHFIRIMNLRRPIQLQQNELLGLESGDNIKLTVLNHQQVKFSCPSLLENAFTDKELSNLQDLYFQKEKKSKVEKTNAVKQFYEAALRELLLFLYDTHKFNHCVEDYDIQEDIERCARELDNFYRYVSIKLNTSIANYTLNCDSANSFLCNQYKDDSNNQCKDDSNNQYKDDKKIRLSLCDNLQQQSGKTISVKSVKDKVRIAIKGLCSSNIKQTKGVVVNKNEYQMTKDVVDALLNQAQDEKMKYFIEEVLQMTIAAVKPLLNTGGSAVSEQALITDQPSSPTPPPDANENPHVTILVESADIAALAILNATCNSQEPADVLDYYPLSLTIHAQKDDGEGLNFILLYITLLYLNCA